jgi:hypothetical protein
MNLLTPPKAAPRDARDHERVIDAPDILAAGLALLTFVVFAALVWAGNHQH